jgi:anti-anti-sigma factor
VLRTLAARLFDDVNYYLGGPMASPSWIEAGHRARPAPFVSREAGRSVVWLAGEQDIATVSVLTETLTNVAALDDADLVIDMSAVSFIDTATLRALIHRRDVLQSRSRNLTLRAPSRCTQRLLALCRTVDHVVPPRMGQRLPSSRSRSYGS